MGLDAWVHCRCWQDGLVVPPAGPVVLDGGVLVLQLPYSGNAAAHHAFSGWKTDACPHPGMNLADERVSNWSGLRLFQQALGGNFPTLRAELPDANGGGDTSPERAAPILAELDRFERTAGATDETVLVDEATGRVVMKYVAAYHGVFMLDPDHRAGVDPDGFFVVDPPRTLFRATRFTQRVLTGGDVELTAGEQRAVIAMTPLGSPPAEHLAVASRPRSATDFAHLIGALRRLCAASIETGNAITWA
ncbi:hypothetical protein [Actinoplanes awajinensis]|uniref:Uncharacterized protein n=1 Tax=Actinoplanes awajinensis subsp. mycoplanecinus TaxID=135947 RepID=A0A0X3V735_9ACTN|nr:hypothetical protein [Actinoplanes awajinensis]KUL40042.1 hypothetical protein ADL15_08340 [Actinoplanes awajinensis subsp. mycoplanecinus]